MERVRDVPESKNWGGTKNRRYLKLKKRRIERHKAKTNPNCVPSYGKFKGNDYFGNW